MALQFDRCSSPGVRFYFSNTSSWILAASAFLPMTHQGSASASATDMFTTFDVLQIQSAGHLKSLNGPIRCSESLRTIHSASQLLVVSMHAQISWIFGIWEPAAYMLTTLNPLPLQSVRHCQSVLDPLNVPNVPVLSALWSNYCLWHCRCKHPQFSEFEIMDHMCSLSSISPR